MQAVLNGLTGVGWLLEGERAFMIRVDADDPLPATPLDLPALIGEGRDVDCIEVANASEALGLLRRTHNRQDCLDFALILLDGELAETTRLEAALELNRLLLDWETSAWLEGVLYSAPLPAGTDVDTAIRYAGSVDCHAAVAMLGRLSDLQGVIARVHDAWVFVCGRFLGAGHKEATVLGTRGGVFRHLVHASAGVSNAAYDEFRFASLRALQPIPNHRQLVDELIQELSLSPSIRKHADRPAAKDTFIDQGLDIERRGVPSLSFDRAAAFDNVTRQKDAIVAHMQAGRLDLVERYVNELIKHQSPLDHRGEYTSKSLCDLAMEAKSLGLFELQLRLARRAVDVRYQDGWAWAQLGDALLILSRFEDALAAYEHAVDFGKHQVGRTGRAHVLLKMNRLVDSLRDLDAVIRDFPTEPLTKSLRAEVLKAMGRLDEALSAYAEVVRDFPTNVVARNGRAEVLKAMGRLDEALVAYAEVVRDFPHDVVARTGRAEVLKAMGRLDEALSAYAEVVRDFPANVVARNGLAEVLKAMGRLDEALTAYAEGVHDFPSNVVARNGRAEVLKAMGRLDEALIAYADVVRDFPSDVVARNGRAEVLKAMGRLDEALIAYAEVVRDFPTNVVARNGRAEVLKAMGRLDEALTAYSEVVRDFPSDVVARSGRAEVLKSMGRLDEALAAYEEGVRDFPTNVVARTGRAEVLKAMGRLDEALAAYAEAVRDFPANAVARNGRAEVLKAMGRLDEALTTYEEVISDFRVDVVARAGRAEVLKAMGRLDEALAAYAEVVRDFPTNVVARTGRAEVLKAMGRLDEALAAYAEVVREFPSDIFARTGRAEVLKAMGRLDQALIEYESVVQNWPHDAFAANGRTALLCALGRYDAALSTLPDSPPRSRQEWIGLHIRGMAMLKMGKIEEAASIFVRGIEQNPFAADRDVFRSAHALVRLQQRAYGEVLDILSNVREIGVDRVASFLRGHSAGALGDRNAAARFLSSTGPVRNDRERELKAELERRFVFGKPPLHDEEWLIHEEVDCMLLAA